MLAVVTRITASDGLSIRGSATVSTATSNAPMHTTAFTTVLPCHIQIRALPPPPPPKPPPYPPRPGLSAVAAGIWPSWLLAADQEDLAAGQHHGQHGEIA